MVNLQITEEADAVLEAAARRAGMTKEEFAGEIFLALETDEALPLSAFTERQLARLMESGKQLDRGEFVTAEEVDRKFEAFFARTANR